MSTVTTTFLVSGMTCGHCVAAVKEEVAKLPSVTEVEIDLASGAVTVLSGEALDTVAIDAAIDEAGYAVVR
jgi:copper chaperone CopZ